MLYFFIISFFLLLPITMVKAVCPVCTVAVCAAVGLSRWLGVDDTVSGVWIGGLIASMIIWTIGWLNKKNIRFLGRKPLVVIGYYLLIIWPLYYYNIIGHPLNKLLGIDKLIFGITIGTIGFIFAVIINNYLKKQNNNKVYFPFQKVVMPIGILAILNLVLYLVCK